MSLLKRFRNQLLAAVLLTASVTTQAQRDGVVVQDSLALVDLFFSTNGPAWITPWNLHEPVINWYGVSVSHTYTGVKERVISLSIRSFNHATGTLPATLSNLTELTYFSIWNNEIGGTIPPSLGQLTKLKTLDLSYNKLTGQIPASLGNLTNLQFLHFQYNQLSGKVPASLGNLQSLLYLYLGENRFNFDGLEEVFARLPNTVIGVYDQPKLIIHRKDSTLSVTAGGTLSNLVFTWTNHDRVKDTVIIADSTFKPLVEGYYSVMVTNKKVTNIHVSPMRLYSERRPVVKLKVYARTPYPNSINAEGNILPYPGFRTESDVKGVAADGVSKVIISVPTYEPISFSLSSEAKGTFSTLQQQDVRSSTITVQPSGAYVQVLYHAPDGYGTEDQEYRERLQILASDPYDNKDILRLQLYTPPVVLVHGMWSKADVWTEGHFIETLKERGITNVHAADYREYSALTYAIDNPESIYSRTAVKGAIRAALAQYRADSIVATQVDIVGHSLGGLVSRSFSQQADFKIPGNYNKGYFHKLITIGTPHRGSPLGPLLWDNRDKVVNIKTGHWPYVIPIKIATVLQMAGMPIGSVHRDFGLQSAGIASLKQTPAYKTFAIKAFYLPTQILDYAALNALVKQVYDTELDKVFASRCSNEIVLPTDVIVPLYSQQGYITKDTLFLGVSHAAVIPLGFTETSSAAIQHKVADLLLTNDNTRFSNGFPAPALQPLDCNTTNARVAQQVVGATSPAVREASNPDNKYVSINSPLPGNVINQGQTTQLSLSYQTGNGLLPTGSTFIVDGLGIYEVTDLAAGSVTISLPADAAAGQHKIVLFSRDNNGNLYADTSYLVIKATGTLDSITTSPARILLDSATRQLPVTVYGHYSQGGITRQEVISTAADGTTYQAKKGTQLVTTTPNGMVRAASYGTDTLIVTNGGKQVRVPIIVDANFYYAQKLANAISFAAIADKPVNAAPFTIEAYAVSGEPVAFTVVSGPATVQQEVVTVTGPGTVTIRASSAGNVYFNNAQAVTQSFNVSGALPVTWAAFTASRINDAQVTLQWETSTEQNNSGFVVERRLSGAADFVAVGNVASQRADGNSVHPLSYQFTDNNDQPSVTEYRIRQVDLDGRSSYSVIRMVPGATGNQLTAITINPNPVTNGFTVKAVGMRGVRQGAIHDVQGRLIRTVIVQAGQFVPLTGLPAGTYTLTIKDAFRRGSDERVKLVVQ